MKHSMANDSKITPISGNKYICFSNGDSSLTFTFFSTMYHAYFMLANVKNNSEEATCLVIF